MGTPWRSVECCFMHIAGALCHALVDAAQDDIHCTLHSRLDAWARLHSTRMMLSQLTKHSSSQTSSEQG